MHSKSHLRTFANHVVEVEKYYFFADLRKSIRVHLFMLDKITLPGNMSDFRISKLFVKVEIIQIICLQLAAPVHGMFWHWNCDFVEL